MDCYLRNSSLIQGLNWPGPHLWTQCPYKVQFRIASIVWFIFVIKVFACMEWYEYTVCIWQGNPPFNDGVNMHCSTAGIIWRQFAQPYDPNILRLKSFRQMHGLYNFKSTSYVLPKCWDRFMGFWTYYQQVLSQRCQETRTLIIIYIYFQTYFLIMTWIGVYHGEMDVIQWTWYFFSYHVRAD